MLLFILNRIEQLNYTHAATLTGDWAFAQARATDLDHCQNTKT